MTFPGNQGRWNTWLGCLGYTREMLPSFIILSMFSKLLDTENECGLLYHAVYDRIKNKAIKCEKRGQSGHLGHDPRIWRPRNVCVDLYYQFGPLFGEHFDDA